MLAKLAALSLVSLVLIFQSSFVLAACTGVCGLSAKWVIQFPASPNSTTVYNGVLALTNGRNQTANLSFTLSGDAKNVISMPASFAIPANRTANMPFTVTVTSQVIRFGQLQWSYALNGSSSSSGGLLVEVEVRPTSGTPTPTRISLDVDGDGVAEQAIDANFNLTDGYEVFNDTNSNTIGMIVHANGSKTQYLLDTNRDGTYEKFWDPERAILNAVRLIGQRYLLDSNNDGTPETIYLDGSTLPIARLAQDVDNDGDLDTIFDLDANGTIGSADRVWEGDILTLPDVTIVEIATVPAQPIEGAAYNITVKVKNQGEYPANFFKVSLAIGSLVQEKQVQSLGNGSEQTLTYMTNASAGSNQLAATADTENLVQEADEANNARTYSFTPGSQQTDLPPADNPSPPAAAGGGGGGGGGGSSPSAGSAGGSVTKDATPPAQNNASQPASPSSNGNEIIIEDQPPAENNATETNGAGITGQIAGGMTIAIAGIVAVVILIGAVFFLRGRAGV